MPTVEATESTEDLLPGEGSESDRRGFDSSSSSSLSLPSRSPGTSPDVLSDDDSAADLDLCSAEYLGDGVKYVMVVGGLGYIGSHTTLELLKSGYNVIVIDNLSNSYASVFNRISMLAKAHNVAQHTPMPVFKFHRVDYRSRAMRWVLDLYSESSTDPERTSKIVGVIHFAAYKSVEESLRKPLEYYRNNVCGLVDFLALLHQFGIRTFVFSSSAAVYGAKTKAGKPLKEDDLVHEERRIDNEKGETLSSLVPGIVGLTSPYSRTKYFCEAILADVAATDSSWNIISLRYFNPVGCDPSGSLGEDPRQSPTNLFPVIARVLRGEQAALEVYGTDWETRDGTAVRDFIHVVDLALGHVAALDAGLAGRIAGPFRTYNLGTGEGATVLQVVKAVEEVACQEIPLCFAARRPGDVGYCVAATQRAELELGWVAKKRLIQCARDMWNFSHVNGNVQASSRTCPSF